MSSKTNAVRLAEAASVPHMLYTYAFKGDPPDGQTAAALIGKPPELVYKTLVTQAGKHNYVFVIPVCDELDLKAAARAVNEKSVEMLPVKNLLQTTGYIKGGCSPIGMKKPLVTVLDESALALPTILVSAGKPGMQIELSPQDLMALTGASPHKITRNKGE